MLEFVSTGTLPLGSTYKEASSPSHLCVQQSHVCLCRLDTAASENCSLLHCWKTTHQRAWSSSGAPDGAGPDAPPTDALSGTSALHDTAAIAASASAALDLAGGTSGFEAAALEGAWYNVALAVKAVDALHSATGLPWWATLSLAAFGEHHCVASSAPLKPTSPPLHLRGVPRQVCG